MKSSEMSLVFSKIVSKGLCCDKVWGISIFPSCTPIRGIYRKSLLIYRAGVGDFPRLLSTWPLATFIGKWKRNRTKRNPYLFYFLPTCCIYQAT